MHEEKTMTKPETVTSITGLQVGRNDVIAEDDNVVVRNTWRSQPGE